MRRGYTKGLRYTIDLSKIADRENPRTVEAPIHHTSSDLAGITGGVYIDWGDGSTEHYTSGSWQEHTYAEGAGDVFTVVIRSATGQLPRPRPSYSYQASEQTNPTKNITFAIVSIDHISGELKGNASYGSTAQWCKNLRYTDPRYIGNPMITNIDAAFNGCDLTQDFGAFCFDFSQSIGVIGTAFKYNSHLYGSPEHKFDQCVSITNLYQTFYGCAALAPPPFVFWKADGSVDRDKYPNLTSTGQTYAFTSAALRAQVPTAYGGTMTV